MQLNECYAATTSNIPMEANKCYGTAATDGTTTIPVRYNECYGVAPATDVAQSDNKPETDKYDYVRNSLCEEPYHRLIIRICMKHLSIHMIHSFS